MIENYQILKNGLIKQINFVNKIQEYNIDYVNERYNQYGEKGPQMAGLRFGYLIGVLGFVPKSVLDIGYGNGDFLKVCTSYITDCYGNDVSNYPLPKNIKFGEAIAGEELATRITDSVQWP